MKPKSFWNRFFRQSAEKKERAQAAFQEQFETKLQFRELEPRVVLAADAIYDAGSQTLTITVEDGDSIEIGRAGGDNLLYVDGLTSSSGDGVFAAGKLTLDTATLTSITITDTNTNNSLSPSMVTFLATLSNGTDLDLSTSFTTLDNVDAVSVEMGSEVRVGSLNLLSTGGNSDDGAISIEGQLIGDVNVDVSNTTGKAFTVTSTATGSVAGSNFTINRATTAGAVAIDLELGTHDLDTLSQNVTSDEVRIALTDTDEIELGDIVASEIKVTAGGAIQDTAATQIVVSGTASFTGTEITLNQSVAGHDFAKLTLVTSVADAKIAETNGFAFDGASSIAGNLQVETGGNLSQSGGTLAVTGTTTLTVADDANVTLDQANDFGGQISVVGNTESAATVTLNDASGDLTLGQVQAKVLTATSAGAILQGSGELEITQTASFAAGGAITLETATNQFRGIVNASSAGFATSLADIDAIELGKITSGSLKVNVGGAITQASSTRIATGDADLTAGGSNITLNNTANDFTGSVDASGAEVSFVDSNAIELGEISASKLTVNVEGTITQTSGEKIVVAGETSLTATGFAITLANAANDFGGSVTVSGTDISLADANAIVLGDVTASTFSVVAYQGNITQAATATILAGDTSITVSEGKQVTLLNSGNDFTGAVSVTSLDMGTQAGDIKLFDENTLELGTIAAQSLEVETNGSVTQAAAATLNITGETVVRVANLADVTLANSGNEFLGAVSVTGMSALDVPNAVKIQDASDLILGNIEANSLEVIAAGNVTQASSATLNIETTTAVVTIDGAQVILFNAGNDFRGAVSAVGATTTDRLSNVQIRDDVAQLGVALMLGDIRTDALTIRAEGSVQQTPGSQLLVSDTTDITVANGAGVVLFNSGNDFGGVISVVGIDALADTPGQVSIRDDIADGQNVALRLGNIKATSLEIMAAGTITQPTDGSTKIVVTTGSTDLQLTAKGDIDLRYGDNDIFSDTGLGKSFTVTLGLVPENLENFYLRNVNATAGIPTGDLPTALAGGTMGNVTFDLPNSLAVDLPTIAINENLVVNIAGNLTQSGDIAVGQNASFAAGTMTLAATNDLIVTNQASFIADKGDIEVGVVSTANKAYARGTASGQETAFGTVTFSAANFAVTIAEGSIAGDRTPGMNLAGDNRGKSVVLTSANGIATDALSTLTVTDLASFYAQSGDLQLGNGADEAVNLRIVYAEASGNISIHEQADTNGLSIVDGTQAGGILALKTGGPIIQVNDFRTGAVSNNHITASQALLHSGGGILLTSLDVNVLAGSAAGTPLFVTPGMAFDITTAGLNGSDGFGGLLTTDTIDADLPDENSDRFAVGARADSFVDGVGENYSFIAVNDGNLTIAKVTDTLGDIGSVNGLATNGADAGHAFVRTTNGGDLTFGAAGSSSVVVDLTNSGVITALASGTLSITDGFSLHSSKGAGGVGDLFAVVSQIVQFDDRNLPPPNTQFEIDDPASWGPAYIRIAGTVDTYLLNTSTGVDTQAIYVLTQLGEAGEMDFVLVTDWRQASDPASPAVVGFDGVVVLEISDNIDSPTSIVFVYPWQFATTHASVEIQVSAYNSPQINLFQNVDATSPTNLNVVNDSFTMFFKTPIDSVPLTEAFVAPSLPLVPPAPIEVAPTIVTNSLVETSEESRASTSIEGVTVVEVNPNDLEMTIGEEIKLDGEFMTLDAVKELIQRDERFHPGLYRIVIVYPGIDQPQISYYEKQLRATPTDIFGLHDRSVQPQSEEFAFVDKRECSLSPEDVWQREYDKWFSTDIVERVNGEEGEPVEEGISLDRVSMVELDEIERLTERLRAKHESVRESLGSTLVGGTLLMAAVAVRQREAVQQSAEQEPTEELPEDTELNANTLDRLRRRMRRWL